MDGTLIQTEVLKATSYARAINSLTDNSIQEQQVLDSFGKYVGLSKDFFSKLQEHLGISEAHIVQDRLIEKRLSIYRAILDDTDLLTLHFCPFTMGLFNKAHSDGFKVVLATMSHFSEAKRITSTMGIFKKFDLVLTRDTIQEGKPNPEIYLRAKDELGLKSEECLVIEDSVNGVKAALEAGMPVFAVTNDVTRKSVHDSKLLPTEFIVDKLEELTDSVYRFIKSKA